MCELTCCGTGSMLHCYFSGVEEDTDFIAIGSESVFHVPFDTIQTPFNNIQM